LASRQAGQSGVVSGRARRAASHWLNKGVRMPWSSAMMGLMSAWSLRRQSNGPPVERGTLVPGQ
jgi:hypothetical protein